MYKKFQMYKKRKRNEYFGLALHDDENNKKCVNATLKHCHLILLQ